MTLTQKTLPAIKPAYDWTTNQLRASDHAFHNWYRFVLSFPAHLVRTYIDEFRLGQNQTLLDPFAGTGTTLVEAKLAGITSIGIEANPFAHFASSIKTNWRIDSNEFFITALKIAEDANKDLKRSYKKGKHNLLRFDSERSKLLIKNSISPQALNKTLVLKNRIEEHNQKKYYGHLLLALAKSTVFESSNLRFGPEVGIGKIQTDPDVISFWLEEIKAMVRDLITVGKHKTGESTSLLADSRDLSSLIAGKSISAVITSPPYPNEKDYSRTTRLESVLLDFIKTREELRNIKKTLIRSNTRNIYKDDNDHKWTKHLKEVEAIAQKIEERRKELGKTSGFERLYPKVTREYFGGMARHLAQLRPILLPGARLAYVVGDQASYLRVMIRTGQILGKIAEELGYKLERIDLFRERYATATKEVLREEVVILTWDGKQQHD